MNIYEVTYTVKAVIAAKDEMEANALAIKQFREIMDDMSYESKEVETLPIKHNWNLDFVPYGNNPKGLTIAQIRRRSAA